MISNKSNVKVFGNTSKIARIKEHWKHRTEPFTASVGYIQDVKWLIKQAELVEDLKKKNAELQKKVGVTV